MTKVENVKKGQPKVNTLDQKKRTPLISWRGHQTMWRSLDSEDLARHRRPHQTWKTFGLKKHLRDPNSTPDLSSFIDIHIKGSKFKFIFFLPHVQTDKGLQRQYEWTNTFFISNRFLNDYPTKLLISGNGTKSLTWSFSMNLNALAHFSNVSEIPAYLRSWRPWRKLTRICYFYCAITQIK